MQEEISERSAGNARGGIFGRFVSRYFSNIEGIVFIASVVFVALTGSVLFFMWWSTTKSVDYYSELVARELEDSITEHILSYMEPAARINTAIDNLIRTQYPDPIGSAENGRKLLGFYREMMSITPQAKLLYYSDDRGNQIMLANMGGKGYSKRFIINDGRSIREHNEHEDPSLYRDFPDTESSAEAGFDPRKRGWYQLAREAGGAAWTPFYLFVPLNVPGITHIVPEYDGEGRLTAVSAIDITIDDISRYLGTLHPTPDTKIVLLDENKNMVGLQMEKPEDLKQLYTETTAPDGSQSIEARSIEDCPDEVCREVLSVAGVSGGEERMRRIEYGGVNYRATLRAVTVGTALTLYAGIIIPEKDIIGSINRNLYLTVGLTAIIIIMILVLTVRFSIRQDVLKRLVDERTRQFEEQAALAREASRAKSDFLTNMSHEIRTPMNTIIGMCDIMPQDNFTALQKRYFGDLRKMSNALLDIINGILDLSKVEAGKMELIPVHYNIRELFNSVAMMHSFIAAGKSLGFTASCGELEHEVVFGDEIRIRQILTNLLGNAIKYTREGSVTFTLSEADGFFTAKVSDTGIGIKEEDIPKLCGIFQQLDTKKNRDVQGTGLGLAITRRLSDMMGGSINVESVYGKGSTFTFTWPLVPGNPEEVARAQDSPGFTCVKPGRTIRALVVDDTPVNITVALGHLARHGITAETAGSGQEAIDKIAAARGEGRPYDIVFMDHMMPGMDGVEATKRIREDEKTRPGTNPLPVIALTANAISGMEEMFLSNGMNDFLAKPIAPPELNRILIKWLPGDRMEVRDSEDSGQGDAARKDAALLSPLAGLLDLDDALSHVAGARALISCLKQFEHDFDSDIDALRGALASGDIENYRIRIHALKGIFAAAGRADLSAKARTLEDAAKAGDRALCEAGNAGAVSDFAGFKKELSEALRLIDEAALPGETGPEDGGEPPAGETLDRAGLIALLETLAHTAFRSEIGGVSDALDALERANITGLEARERERLARSLTLSRELSGSLDFPAIAAETKALLNDITRPA